MNPNAYSLPIVKFGKYKGQPVTELCKDTEYIDWLKSQPNFQKTQPQIYNIIVNQTLTSANVDAKTPDHNRLQNLFLEEDNRAKLIKCVLNPSLTPDKKLKSLCLDKDFIKTFGHILVPEQYNLTINSSVVFEGSYNWDLNMYHKTYVDGITILTVNEQDEYRKCREDYDKLHKELYSKFDVLIEYRKLLESDFLSYIQKRNEYTLLQERIIVETFKADYNIYKERNPSNDDTHTSLQEKQRIKMLVENELTQNMELWDNMNPCPIDFTHELYGPIIEKIYSKPLAIKRCVKTHYIKLKPSDYEKCPALKGKTHLECVDRLNFDRDTFIRKHQEQYNDEQFEKHYKKTREEYIKSILSKYKFYDVYVNVKPGEAISITLGRIRYGNDKLYCELKPSLGDDYPCVLRKMTSQMRLTEIELSKKSDDDDNGLYCLIVGQFQSECTTRQQLVNIFRQSNIRVVFTEDLFGISSPTSAVVPSTKFQPQPSSSSMEMQMQMAILLEENRLLKNNLSNAEIRINQLEEELNTLKSQKQGKTIKDYFSKK